MPHEENGGRIGEPMRSGEILIGTSGYSYRHWRGGVFYPKGLRQRDELTYYAEEFPTLELNNPFYRLPEESTFDSWRDRTPAGFLFAVKASRYITHMKRLSECEEALERFLTRARRLGSKLGPVLFQLPPQWEANPSRLDGFLDLLPSDVPCAFEFRHASWLVEPIYRALERRGAALCIPSASWMPAPPDIATAPFTYLRMHAGAGPGGGYTAAELTKLARRVSTFSARGTDVDVYFNNDGGGHAIFDARSLSGRLGLPSRAGPRHPVDLPLT